MHFEDAAIVFGVVGRMQIRGSSETAVAIRAARVPAEIGRPLEFDPIIIGLGCKPDRVTKGESQESLLVSGVKTGGEGLVGSGCHQTTKLIVMAIHIAAPGPNPLARDG